VRFELPALKKHVHEMVVPMRWGDMDALGHVNNTGYFRYMEIVRMDWFQRVGAISHPAGHGPLIVNAFCNFNCQLEFPGDLRVAMYVADPGRSSFDTFHTIERVDAPGVTVADGGSRVVWTDYPAKKSAPLPAWLRTLLV
jgi:acyl-CoA thioester hydrolase